jgi:8-oxo-dGTP diphosphatase
VCCFVSYRAEIDTRRLLQGLIDAGHRVAVPRVDGSKMQARIIDDMSTLVDGAFGIPTSKGPVLEQIDIVVVPGLGFTPSGDRLGYGAGHYDRWLSSHATAFTAGLAYQQQVVDVLPTEAHDRQLDVVVTESGVHRGHATAKVSVVGGAVVRDGCVLVARRGPRQRHAGWWELPGGKLEPGETEPQALARELREELGIEVSVGARLDEATHHYPGITVRLAAWSATLAAGEPTATEHDALKWVRPHELADLAWAPADVPLIPAVVRLLSESGA